MQNRSGSGGHKVSQGAYYLKVTKTRAKLFQTSLSYCRVAFSFGFFSHCVSECMTLSWRARESSKESFESKLVTKVDAAISKMIQTSSGIYLLRPPVNNSVLQTVNQMDLIQAFFLVKNFLLKAVLQGLAPISGYSLVKKEETGLGAIKQTAQ